MTRSRKMLWALAIVVVGYIGLTSLPSGTEMLSGADSKRAETQDVRARIALADETGASPEFATSLDNARRLVPAEPALPQVIDSLESAAARAGMRWVAGSPSRLPAADGSWEISLTLNGASRSVPVLLDEIRALPRLLTVSSVQTRGDAEGIILVTVKFYAYAGDPQAFPEVAPE